jgi:hypothetical protein
VYPNFWGHPVVKVVVGSDKGVEIELKATAQFIYGQGNRLVNRKATRLTTKNPKSDTFDDLFFGRQTLKNP